MSGKIKLCCLLLGLLCSSGLPAFEPANGEFQAHQSCLATRRINGPSDGVFTHEGDAYPIIGFNRVSQDFIQIRIIGKTPELRWVSIKCGKLVDISQDQLSESKEPQPHRARQKLLLALSWQPAFCEIKPEKSECATLTTSRYDASHLVLHGLWPQPKGTEYCLVTGQERTTDERRKWQELTPPPLTDEVSRRLDQAMPGRASGLDRHEWIRHGTCFGTDANSYFRTAISLLDQVNASRLNMLIMANIGQTLTLAELRKSFEQSFGAGAGQTLGMYCSMDGERRLITEIHIKLKQPIGGATSMSEALDKSSRAHSNCESGIVDRAGPD